jgi:hypothetical protein
MTPSPSPPSHAGQRQAQQAGLAEFLPQRAVVGVLRRRAAVQHVGGGCRDRLLGLTEGEIHSALLVTARAISPQN